MSLRWLARQVEMPRMQLEMGNSGLGKNPGLETFNLGAVYSEETGR